MKQKDNKKKETKMFTRLRQLNNESKNIKEQKEKNKKMNKTIKKM